MIVVTNAELIAARRLHFAGDKDPAQRAANRRHYKMLLARWQSQRGAQVFPGEMVGTRQSDNVRYVEPAI